MTGLETASDDLVDRIGIVSRRLQHGTVLVLSGEIDLLTAPDVERELLRADVVRDLVAIDLSDVTFLDSSGLHAILAANLRAREQGRRLLIVQGPPHVSRVFELTGLTEHLDLVSDEREVECLAASGDPAWSPSRPV